jgi:hypothetical protein
MILTANAARLIRAAFRIADKRHFFRLEFAMRHVPLAVATIAACLGSTPAAFAWWDQGHMAIAALAYEQLDPAVRATVDRLIKLNPEYAKWTADLPEDQKAEAAFVHAATWADDIKSEPDYARDTVDAPTAG